MLTKRIGSPHRIPLTIALLVTCQCLSAQTVALGGQLVAEDSLQPLPNVTITATSSTRPPSVIETVTGPDGRFNLAATPGLPYRLCAAATGNYADSCRFAKPTEVTATRNMPPVRLTAPIGIRMRLRIIDADGLLRSRQDAAAAPDPLVLHVFAYERATRTRMPLQLAPSTTVTNAVEGATVIPISMRWDLGMSTVRARLFDANGNAYQSNAPIPRPASYGSDEFLAVFTLRAK